MLLEFASLLIKCSSGCCLLQGPFALPPTVALAKVLSCRETQLTWTAHRRHVAHVIRAVETHKSAATFMFYVHGRVNTVSGRAVVNGTCRPTTVRDGLWLVWLALRFEAWIFFRVPQCRLYGHAPYDTMLQVHSTTCSEL
jgi:hypothetical protein